jgi:GTP-binding protein HflX
VVPGGREVLVTDTVGFIQKLPTMLVAAFRATLEEIAEAEVLLHVLDITHDQVVEQSLTVGDVLSDLGASEQPMITVLNKIDQLPAGSDRVASLQSRFPGGLAISAKRGWGLPDLLARIDETLEAQLLPISALIPYSEAGLLALLHQRGNVEVEEHGPDGIVVQGRIPAELAGRFCRFLDT